MSGAMMSAMPGRTAAATTGAFTAPALTAPALTATALTATALTGTGLLGAALAARPGSPRFRLLTAATATTWVLGGLAVGPVPLAGAGRRPPVVGPVALGAAVFGAFYGAAHVARHVPVLDRALGSVLRHADGSAPTVLLTLASGAAEEVFFRGALYTAARRRRPVATTTGVYVLSTVATRNPALVLASAAMGTLFALQRRATGGIQAPVLTHVTWSALMLRYLPPLFRNSPTASRSRSTSRSST
jgi:uncharacterized protein